MSLLSESGQGPVRLGLILLAALAALWLSVAVTIANGFGTRFPERALGLGVDAARVQGAAAAAIVETPGGNTDSDRAARLAAEALRKEPINIDALRALGLVASLRNDEKRAERLFVYSEKLSRRDLATQLWLIESAVRKDDIAGALLHYDRALKTSVRARDILFPILSKAAADPQIARPLGDLLARRPAWAPWFLTHMANDPAASSRSLGGMVARLDLKASNEGDRQILERTLTRLAQDGDFARAQQLYRASAPPASGPQPLLRNGGFEQASPLPPFDWVLADTPDLSALRERLDGVNEDYVLRIRGTADGRNGEVARQLVLLAPGRYRLSLTAGEIAGADALARPLVEVKCADRGGAVLLGLRLPITPDSGAQRQAEFQVPASGCRAQWVAISVGGSVDPIEGAPWIDQVAINRL